MAVVHPQHRNSSCTSSSAHKSDRHNVDEVVEYLQLAGRRYLEHVELLRQEQHMREAQHAPFKPTISAYAEQASKISVVRQGSSIGDRLHELHRRKLELIAEEAAAEAARREAAEQSACTFTPALTAKAEHSARRDHGDASGGDVSALLHRWEVQRRARRVRRQVEAAREELSHVTGVPCISAYAAEKALAERQQQRRAVPIEESLLAVAEARRRRQYASFEKTYATHRSSASTSPLRKGELKGEVYNNDNSKCSSARSPRRFAPAISPYASQVRFEQGVVDRLYTHHRDQHQQEQQEGEKDSRHSNTSQSRSCVFDEEMELHCTFHPRLSPHSRELSRLYYEAENAADVGAHERLYRNTHRPSKYRKSVLPIKETGRPEISETSRKIVEERRRQLALNGDPGALGDSPGSRLYPGSPKTPDAPAASVRAVAKPTLKKKVVTARDIELQTALTFAPEVSPTSDALWRQRVAALKATGLARNADEARLLLWRKAEKKKEEDITKLQGQRRREEVAECTFHPKAGRPPHRRAGYIAMPIEARTQLWAQQRDARLSSLRAEVDASTVADCSFTPHVDPVFPLPRPDAKLAAGVESFVERQVAARRLRAEAAEWWKPQYARTAATAIAQKNRGVSTATDRCASVNPSSRRGMQQEEESREEQKQRPHTSSARDEGSLPRIATTATTASATSSRSTSGVARRGGKEEEEDEEVFVQHWAAKPQPPSTSLTASSFSHASQGDVPSAESSPRQPPYVVVQQQQRGQQHSGAMYVGGEERADVSTGPYRWQQRPSLFSSTSSSAPTTTTPPPWRKPLRYRAR